MKKKISEYFGEKHLEDIPEKSKGELKRQEYIKTPEELELIGCANKKTNEFMKQAGLNPYDVPDKNLHVVPPKLYQEIHGSGINSSSAATIKREQMAIFNADYCRTNPVLFGDDVFHEMMHLKNHFAIEVQKGKEEKAFEFRGSLNMQSAEKTDAKTGGSHEHFGGLEEAAIVFQEKKYFKEMLNLPILKKEKEWLESAEAAELKTKLAEEKKVPAENILWINKEKDYSLLAYPIHYKIMDFLSSEIQKQFSEKYATPDDAALEFTTSSFNGHVLGLAKLVEKTFGKGSFEVLGMMTPEANSAIQMLEYLRRARARQLKKKSKDIVSP